ncbi:MAG: AAA family ATPase [Candidatus Nanohaloarchaea archaeon]
MTLHEITDFNVSKDIENFELDPEEIQGKLHFPGQSAEDLARKISKSIESGKDVIFTGPPGTGKTKLAEITAEEYQKQTRGGEKTEPRIVTATADWSTFDTLGGYMPKSGNGELTFNPGLILKCFKDEENGEQLNQTLVIDEINRSNIDEAFGELFTALTGQKIELPYQNNGSEIKIQPGKESDKRIGPSKYIIPESWRMFATMNTYDKTSLYDMSYAFMRRFAFIQIKAPDVPEQGRAKFLQEYIDVWTEPDEELTLTDEEKEKICKAWNTIQEPELEDTSMEGRDIGPALIEDLTNYISRNKEDDGDNFELYLAEGIASFLLPQLEGIRSGERIVEELKEMFSDQEVRQILEDSKEEII